MQELHPPYIPPSSLALDMFPEYQSYIVFFFAPIATVALGSWPKQGFAKVRTKMEPRVTFHILKSAKECEGMNLHTPK